MNKKWHIILLALAWVGISPVLAFDVVIINNNNGSVEAGLQLTSSSPYDNETVGEAPLNVTLTFSQAIRPDKSYVRVYDLFGKKVSDDTLTASGTSLSVALPELPPGKYTVKWKVRCRCDNETEINDRFKFTVR